MSEKKKRYFSISIPSTGYFYFDDSWSDLPFELSDKPLRRPPPRPNPAQRKPSEASDATPKPSENPEPPKFTPDPQ